MHLEPDHGAAAEERSALAHLVLEVLSKGNDDLIGLVGEDTSAWYPGMVAAAYQAQSARRGAQGATDGQHGRVGLEELAGRARSSAWRSAHRACPSWLVDLASPEVHLQDSLARAVASTPHIPDRAEALAKMTVGDWGDQERAVLCQAVCMLAQAWPAMLAEIQVVVRQIALLDGYGIDGFTDVGTHGAVYLNRQRFEPAADGLPATVRVAEALVHEGTHNRCNAAGIYRPFLVDAHDAPEALMTPLRPDPRPLNGLFQQIVVLVRCLLFYDRLLASVNGGEAVRARRERLLGQARAGLETIGQHRHQLSDHGRAVTGEASQVVARFVAVSA